MTGALLDRPALRPDVLTVGGRVTLEERLTSALHEARANGNTECPVCHARMTPTGDGARCAGCGSRLS